MHGDGVPRLVVAHQRDDVARHEAVRRQTCGPASDRADDLGERERLPRRRIDQRRLRPSGDRVAQDMVGEER